jgi:hypothetical protein
MITLHVWNALQRPPRTHRLFQLAAADLPPPRNLPVSNNILLLGLVLLTGAAFFSRDFSSIISLLIFAAIPLAAANVVFTGPIYGLRWALRSSQLIARLRRSGAYELLCLTPPGSLNVNWMACTAVLYKVIGTSALDARTLWPARMLLALPLVIYLTIQTGALVQPGLNVVVMALYLLLFIVWFRLEDMQSMALGGLLGMLVPSFTRDRLEVRVVTLASYLGIQFASYSAAFFLFQVVLPRLFALLNFDTWLADLSRPTLALALLWSLREGFLRVAWTHLLDRLQSGPEVRLTLGHRV